MGKIVAIGGGKLASGETAKINQYIVSLTSKSNPHLLFIPAASFDAQDYIDAIKEHFGQLGCIVSALCLYSEQYDDETIGRMVFDADIIYVGGGHTVAMMEKFRAHKLDIWLRKAYEKGIILSGTSAGAVCWFIAGHSIMNLDGNIEAAKRLWVKGLGLIPYLFCPHYNEEGRETFDLFMKNQAADGIALENNVALSVIDGEYSIIKGDKTNTAYKLSNDNGSMTKTEIYR